MTIGMSSCKLEPRQVLGTAGYHHKARDPPGTDWRERDENEDAKWGITLGLQVARAQLAVTGQKQLKEQDDAACGWFISVDTNKTGAAASFSAGRLR